MNYTEKYHLPQWEETDRIMRVDFNQMCADMEAGMNQNAQAAAEAAKLPYVVGSYVGNDDVQTITLGFRASYLIISGQTSAQPNTGSHHYDAYNGFSGGNLLHKRLEFSDTGFTVYGESMERDYYPDLNRKDRVYDYIAFR